MLIWFRTPEQKRGSMPSVPPRKPTSEAARTPTAAAEAAKNHRAPSKQALKEPPRSGSSSSSWCCSPERWRSLHRSHLAIETGFDTMTSSSRYDGVHGEHCHRPPSVFGTISRQTETFSPTTMVCVRLRGFRPLGIIFFARTLYMFFGSLFFYGCLSATLGDVGTLQLLGTVRQKSSAPSTASS